MGDFYHGRIQWKSLQSTGREDQQFKNLVQDSFLIQHVLEPTRRGENLLDIVLSSQKECVDNVKICEPLGCSVVITTICISSSKVKGERNRKLVYMKEDYAIYKEATAEIINSKRNYEHKLAFNIKYDSNNCYAYVRSKQKAQDEVGPLESNDGNKITEGLNGRKPK